MSTAAIGGAVDRISVLIVDESLFARALAGVLSREDDLEVVAVASTPQEAAEIAASDSPDVVITAFDLQMGNALDVVRLVHEQNPATRVVVISSQVDTTFLVATIGAGCSGFLTRRQKPEDVVRAVRATHAGDLPIDPVILRQLVTNGEAKRRPGGPDLTERERSVLALLAEGLTHADIAEALHVSVNTVRNHAQRVLEKLGAHSRFEAVIAARRRGLLSD